jgi:predicted nucleotidyltransferase component of viral defense system
MKIEKKNLSESVYSRLKNIALAKNRPTQEVLRYYAMERFLYRLSVSQHKRSFFLKGGLMLMVWDPTTHRATVDIDLLAKANNSIENISRILKEICSHPVLKDGIEFNSTELILAESQVETEYTGLSAHFSAHLHTAKLPLRIDIGFSDKIFPKPATVDYPALLDFPSPELQGYTPETMIAEKLDAMVKLGLASSRMKDFYDIWTIVNQFQIKPEKIAPVIKDVFQNRKTVVREIPKAFSEAFYNMPKTLERWDAFLKGIGHDPVPLEKVIFEIRDFFLPILSENGAQIAGINS